MEELFYKDKTCLLCEVNFKSAKVKRSKQRMLKRDSDFCVHYKGPNPSFYTVFVCPECGYGFTDNFTPPRSPKKEAIRNEVEPVNEDLSGSRTVEEAILAFKIALKCALLGEERKTIIAGLYLHLGWFNRFRENEEEEKNNLGQALQFYEKAIETERDLKDPATVFYLIGELNHRLGDDKKAVTFFSRLIDDKQINDPNIIRMARERWKEIRSR